MDFRGCIVIGAVVFVFLFFIIELINEFECELYRYKTGRFAVGSMEFEEQYKEWLELQNLPKNTKTLQIFIDRFWEG